jgi:putative toxin-antitoxin system antitoxin component (TIGR02293 family)
MNLTDERKTTVTKPRTGVKKAAPAKAKAAPVRKTASPVRKVTARLRKGAAAKSYRVVAVGKGRVVSAVSLLGVTTSDNKEFLTWMEWVSVIRQGIPSTAVDSLIEFLSISKTEFSDAIDIPFRTLVRRKGEALLASDESAKLVRVARVIERAEEVFEDPDAARVWLKSANISLSGQTPMSLLDTEIGAESVMNALGRIEHGVFA